MVKYAAAFLFLMTTLTNGLIVSSVYPSADGTPFVTGTPAIIASDQGEGKSAEVGFS